MSSILYTISLKTFLPNDVNTQYTSKITLYDWIYHKKSSLIIKLFERRLSVCADEFSLKDYCFENKSWIIWDITKNDTYLDVLCDSRLALKLLYDEVDTATCYQFRDINYTSFSFSGDIATYGFSVINSSSPIVEAGKRLFEK